MTSQNPHSNVANCATLEWGTRQLQKTDRRSLGSAENAWLGMTVKIPPGGTAGSSCLHFAGLSVARRNDKT